jgi:hypothetical protein
MRAKKNFLEVERSRGEYLACILQLAQELEREVLAVAVLDRTGTVMRVAADDLDECVTPNRREAHVMAEDHVCTMRILELDHLVDQTVAQMLGHLIEMRVREPHCDHVAGVDEPSEECVPALFREVAETNECEVDLEPVLAGNQFVDELGLAERRALAAHLRIAGSIQRLRQSWHDGHLGISRC